jgi:hypothetical protein
VGRQGRATKASGPSDRRGPRVLGTSGGEYKGETCGASVRFSPNRTPRQSLPQLLSADPVTPLSSPVMVAHRRRI